jgi:hypothetical protein
MDNFLVAICLRQTKEVVAWIKISAVTDISAIHLVFEKFPHLFNSNTHYGESIKI